MEEQQSPKRRQTKKDRQKTVRMQMTILAVIVLVLVLLTILLVTQIRKKKASGDSSQATQTEQAAVTGTSGTNESEGIPTDGSAQTEETVQNLAPTAEDGSGDAGLLPMDDYMKSFCTQAGLATDGQNSWYTPDMVNCYYNGWFTSPEGLTYHFDTSGLADYGWKLIGGKGCYFDTNAVYQPDQRTDNLLAFTFDDGPSQGMDQILELCEQTGARVTFFMIGAQVENGGAVIPHIIKDRCEVGNHSNTHTQMTKVSTEECVQNFKDCDSWIQSFAGTEADVYRFPYGDYTEEELASIGKPAIMWSVDSMDWDLLEAQPVIEKVLNEITEGDIILMHDRYDSTVEACQYLFPYLVEQGYQLVTVRELAAAKGYDLEAGKAYYGFCQEYIDGGYVTQ